jgi:hypothetical protein
VGSLRSGSSLLARCLDDHPEAICLCESEINRTLFPRHHYLLHFRRMRNHGLEPEEIMQLLDGKQHYNTAAYELWHSQVFALLKSRYGKPEARALGDKSPDFYRSPILVGHLLASHRLIYTVRDPRAIYRSIQADKTGDMEKRNRWGAFRKNVEVWKPHFDETPVLVVRYEDLVSDPESQMARIHRHLDLGDSQAFLDPGPRKHAQRFLWKTNVDMSTGEVRAINPAAADRWRTELSREEIQRIEADPLVREYCERFGYEMTQTMVRRSCQALNCPEVITKPARKTLILDWGNGPVLDHIAAALSKLGHTVIRHPRSGPKRADIIHLIERERPNLCVTRQRLYIQDARVNEALVAVGCRTLFVDLGVWPHYQTYLMDCAGDNAASSIVGNLARLESDPAIRASADLYEPEVARMRDALLKRAEEASSRPKELGLEDLRDYSLLVLQRGGDQVLIHDGPKAWRNPKTLALSVIAEVERTNRFVVVKPHPMSADDFDIAPEGPHHRVVDGFRCGALNDRQLAWLMVNANNAIMINSTAHFQTLALGVPTVCLGRGWFSDNGVVVEAGNLKDALSATTALPGAERYLCHMLSRQMPVAKFGDPTSLEDLMQWVLRFGSVGESPSQITSMHPT